MFFNAMFNNNDSLVFTTKESKSHVMTDVIVDLGTSSNIINKRSWKNMERKEIKCR